MQQLNVGDVMRVVSKLRKKYTLDEIMSMPIYIGDDDEMNGIHCAWFCQEVGKDNDLVVDLINERSCNHKFNDKCILIS